LKAHVLPPFHSDLTTRFPERKDVTTGSLAAVLAGEHVLLLGPPGTAKSTLARAIAQAFGGIYFERLLTKFSMPEELFGSVSLKALEQDRFARVVTGKLRDDFTPTSDVDVLVEFEPGHVPGLAFFSMEAELSTILGRKVDLNTPGFLSRYFRDQVLAEAETQHVAA
jgi:predicted nucleotidyltransferase